MLSHPSLDLTYLRHLTDDFGIWQHTRGLEIDREMGYALDDSARALLVALEYKADDLAEVYHRFLRKAVTGVPGQIVNFFDGERRPLPRPWSEDALAQTYWAMARSVEANFLVSESTELARHIETYIKKYQFLRGYAYALLGANTFNPTLASWLAERILLSLPSPSSSWYWPEEIMTYANGVIPWSLLVAAERLSGGVAERARLAGEHSLRFLNGVMERDGKPAPVGSNGWYVRGGEPAKYDQQPIEAAYSVLANMAAYRVTKLAYYKEQAQFFISWFWGNNSISQSLIDLETGSVLDGIREEGLNSNRGAENIICYLLAQKALIEQASLP